MMKRIITALAWALLPLLWLAMPVMAIGAPTGTPLAFNFHVNRNLITSGDYLFYGRYDLPYSSTPTEPVNNTYIFRLLETATGAERGAIVPYPFFDNGYNEGVFSFYFTDNITWEGNYTVQIAQNPFYFASPQTWNYDITASSAFSPHVTQESNQAELTSNIKLDATWLKTYYSDYDLLESSAGGQVLSNPDGENYFRGAIPGLQAMASDLFLVQVLSENVTARAWTTAQFDTYKGRFDSSWAGVSENATANQFGLTRTTLMASIFSIPVILCFIVVSARKWKRIEPGLIFGIVVMIGTSLMGWFPMGLFAVIMQLLIIYLAYIIFKGQFSWHFLSFVWLASTVMCLILEGSWIGTAELSVINDLSIMTTLKIGNALVIPAPNLLFFRGVVRLLIWDYSFYSGGYAIFRVLWIATLSPALIWDITQVMAPIFANFLRLFPWSR